MWWYSIAIGHWRFAHLLAGTPLCIALAQPSLSSMIDHLSNTRDRSSHRRSLHSFSQRGNGIVIRVAPWKLEV